MVVVHNYSEGQKKLEPSDSSQNRDDIDEDRAYVVGIWVVVIIAAIIIVLFVLFAIGRSQEQENLAAQPEETKEDQVLGEKEESEAEETKTEIKEDAPKDVKDLERPLSEDELIAKAEQIPGSKIHTVAPGESLYTIGEEYNVDWREIAELSNLSPPYNLHSGQKLIIPPKGGASED